MLRQYLKAWSKHNSGNRKHRGFTLAELIVVLAIVAILATVGVFAAVGYINRSRIDKNTQDAITVYQVAQTAIAHKADNGTLDNWVSTAFSSNGFSAADFKDNNGRDILDETNKSIHKTAHLTYDPNKVHADSDTLYDLLSPYFYDRAVFAGTISVEFDLSATKQNDGTIAYSATVMSAFYSRENVAPTGTGGWDSKCLGNSNDQLPQRDQDYRYNTSYVGYFNGTEASLIGPVALPDDLDATPAAEVTFRNGETLDITWTILADHDKTDDVYINLFNSDSLAALTDDSSSNNPASIATILIEGGESAIESKATTTQANDYECIKVNTEGHDHTYNIEKTVKTGVITIKVSTNNGSSYVEHTFPVTVREVFGDGRQEITQYADMSQGYKTYTLSIDCMMVHREYTSLNSYYTKNYTSKVLFGANKNQPYNPQNICATLVTGTNSDSDYFVATRAIDDPIHYEGLTQGSFRNGTHTAVSYNLEDGNRAALDTEKGCVVNTLFGDLVCSDGNVTYNGSFASSQGGDAVITSFRHLSNIRMTNVGDFHIARDLNWYIKASGSLTPYSEVKVYNIENSVYNSPIDRTQSSVADSYRVVSFPAIDEIKANQSLSAIHRSDDPTQLYSINSVQMRLGSFTNNDEGFALICKNSGTVYNLVTNNLNLVVYGKQVDGTPTSAPVDANAPMDGSPSDYSSIEATSITTGNNANRPIGPSGTAGEKLPIGGLIGLNNGKVGTTDSDVIRMSNSIVMSSKYWTIEKYFQGTGGVIGYNTGSNASLNGEIEINGTFVVFGHTNIGGIIGCSDQNIGARLIVNGTTAPESEFNLSNDQKYGAVSCVVAGWNSPGGAVGKMENGAFTYRTDHKYDGISSPDQTGNFTFNNFDQYDYQIDVNLPVNSLIVQLTTGNKYETDANGRLRGAGGAIGNMKNCNNSSSSEGNYLSIRVQNEGSILSANNTNDQQNHIYCGGAVGRDENSKITTTFVRVVNGENTRIGYPSDNKGPNKFTAGGAYGQINGSGRTVAIYVENKGTITARGSDNYLGVGGAVGGTSAGDVPTFVIKAINNSAEITDLNNDGVNMVNGAGGAIGSISNDKEISSDSVIYVENTNTTISGYYFVGGAIGNAPSNNGKISVVNDGATITGVGSTNYVGGAIGRITGNSTGGTIQVVLDSCNIRGGEYVGGVIGLNDSVLSSVSIEGSGNIIGTGNYVGGAIGYNNGEIGGDVDVALSGNVNGGGNYVGGAIGYNNETISGSVDTEFIGNISGFNFVGGAIGQNKAEIGGSVTVLYTGDSSVIGIDYVGGAIGSNDEQITDNVEVSATGDLVIGNENHSGSYVGGVIGDSVGEVGGIAASFDGEVSIYGVDYVGGAVGNLSGDLTIDKSISIVFAEASEIHGRINVGGVIGKNDVELASVSARFNGPGTVIGSSDVGGSIGYNNNDISGTVSAIFEGQAIIGNASNPGDNVGGVIGNSVGEVGGISVAFGDDAYIYGYDNVGGAAGNLIGEITTSKVIDVVFTADTVIRGNNNVGGAIGNNEVALTSVTATFKGDAQVIGSENVGGAIGNTEADISGAIAASFKGEAIVGNKKKTGNYVGGVIGNCKNKAGSLSADFADDAFIYGANYVGGVVGNLVGTLTTNTISVVFNGDCEIYGANNVGGAIGYNEVALTSVTATFKHDGKVIGSSYVGGAIGNSQAKVTGTVSASFSGLAIIGDSSNPGDYVGGVIGNSVGDIGGITVAFGKDTSIYGKDYVGGAVGNLLGSLTSNKSISVYVPGDLTIKAANNVGGVVGYSFVKGLNDVTVKVDGITNIECSGGNVGGAIGYHWNNNNNNYDNPYNIKGIISANFGKAVTVSGNGDYVGGVIGNSYSNIKGIAVTYGSSANISGKNYVGGMAGYLKGGLDNRTIAMTVPGDFTINGVDYVGGVFGYNTASLNGITVKYNGTASITGKKYIGGAMGYNNKFNSSNPVSVLYSKTAEIIGSECVGGAIGQSVGKTGMLSADFKGRATIGDNINKGNYIGGVIGNSMAEISGIKVTFADDVNIYGADYVGGAVGNLQGKVNTDKSISVSVPGNLTINAADKVGGAIGYSKVELKDVSVSVAGKTEITSTAGNVGGAIGLHDTATINGTISASFGDTVKISGVSDYVGGVIGHSHFDIGGVQVSYDSTVDISGKNYVGGMVGNLRGGVTNNNIVMTVTDDFSLSGENYVGGAFGYNKATLPTVNVIYSKTVTISGKSATGGVIGFNEKVKNESHASVSVQYDDTVNINGTDGVGGVIGKNIGTLKNITATYNDVVSVVGNENVGGAIGRNEYAVSGTVTVSYAKSGTITGSNYTGGVIGYNSKTISGTVSADFNGMATIGNSSNAGECVGGVIGSNFGKVDSISATFAEGVSIYGTDYVGGAIGKNDRNNNNNNVVPGNVTVSYEKSGTITGSNYTGGVIGYNSMTISGTVSADFNGKATIGNSSNTGACVGGVIGNNIGSIAGISVAFKDDADICGTDYVGGVIGNNGAAISGDITVTYENSGSLIGSNYAGGALGYNNKTISGTVSVDFNGKATIGNSSNTGACVGGVIGSNIGSLAGISAAFRDDADICGTDYVGGAIGNNGAAISGDITVTYEKSGSLIGSNDVGGAIGYNNKKISGTVSADFKGMATIGDSNNTGNYVGGVIGNSSGEITSDITAAFRDDVSICGSDYVGGVIGNNGAAISGTVNVSYENSGLIDGADYVGGVIGYNNKNLYGISVDLSDVSIYGNDSVGGAFGSYAGGTITNGITVEATNLEIVGNEMVGGAIGSVSGGNINGRTIDFTDVEIRTITGKEDGGSLSIDLTNAEITGNKKVGGAIGSVSGGSINNGIVESLNHSYVGGIEEVGGVIGVIKSSFKGGMLVTYSNETYFGDKKDVKPYRCVDVGGAIGYFTDTASISTGRVLIKFDETSMVYAGGTDYDNSDVKIEDAGVGGAFGRIGLIGKGNTPQISLSADSTPLASVEVYCKSYDATVSSASSIAGGFVGHMLSGKIRRCYSTAVVSGYNYVGGFVGKMENGSISNSYVGGHTYKGQYDSGEENIKGENYVGGFAGYISEGIAGSRSLSQIYSTASVKGKSNVGGFAGYIGGNNKELFGCYCTGLVSLKPGGDPDTIGAFAGCVDDIDAFLEDRDGERNGNKALRYVNDSNMRRIGTINGVQTDSDEVIPKVKLRWAYWGEVPDPLPSGLYRNDYIRVYPKTISQYDAAPFDDTLDPSDEKFPLRTFITQSNPDGTFFGFHYGDWPAVMTESTKLLSDTNTRIIFVDDSDHELLDGEGNPITEFPYAIGDAGVTPKVKVYFTDESGEHDITDDPYITISYKDNIIPGEAKVIVSGDGEHYGHSVIKSFTIVPLDISDATVTIDTTAAGFIYNGQPQEPAVKVILSSGEELPAGDYQVAYSDNTNAGTATVTVTPDNTKYVVNNTSGTPGTLSAEFIIDKKKIEAADMNVTCSGEVDAPIITVSVTIEGNATTLDASDYSAVLSDSKDKLTVTIDAANFYSDPVEYTVHTVTFMMNDESGDVYKTLIVMDNGTVSAPADPSRENYAFQGWITDPDDPDSAFAWDTQITSDGLVLYASWTANRGAVPSTDESNGEENGEGTDADTDTKDEGNLEEDNGSKKGVENDDATNTRSTVDPTESGTGGSSGETADVDDDETISGSPDETPGEGSDESAGGDDDESTGEVPGGDDESTGEVPGGDVDESAGESAGGTEDNTFDEATDETAGDTTNGATDGDSNSDTDDNAGGGSEGEIGGGTGGDSGGGNNTDPGSDPGGAPQDPVPGNNENPTP